MTTDIFENTILCNKCNKKMQLANVSRNGFILRAVVCPYCGKKIIHPKDEQEYNDFTQLRKKEFNVKMRFIGNSYAVSIPKEIVIFMREHEKMMNDMVKLCLEEFGRVSLDFNSKNIEEKNNEEWEKKKKLN